VHAIVESLLSTGHGQEQEGFLEENCHCMIALLPHAPSLLVGCGILYSSPFDIGGLFSSIYSSLPILSITPPSLIYTRLAQSILAPSATGMAIATNDDAGVAEERRISEEYKIWKKNTPFLYDMVSD
jgi:Histone-binding protein RBBP4 or subunit C of CAF1 complex